LTEDVACNRVVAKKDAEKARPQSAKGPSNRGMIQRKKTAEKQGESKKKK